MAKKCARTFSIVVEKGKKSILDVRHLLPVGIARSARTRARPCMPAALRPCTSRHRPSSPRAPPVASPSPSPSPLPPTPR